MRTPRAVVALLGLWSALALYCTPLVAATNAHSAANLHPPLQLSQSSASAAKLFGVPDGCDDGVRAILRAPSGLVYLAGDFSICEDVRAAHVVAYNPHTRHFQALGTRNAEGVDGSAFALALVGDTLYVGGTFANAGGQLAANIARWDGSGWSSVDDGTVNGVAGAVTAMTVVSNGDLVVGGNFAQAGAVSAQSVARWNGSRWTALGAGIGLGGAPGQVHAMAFSAGQLFVGGDFDRAGGVPANNIARWDGQGWTPLGSGAGSRATGDVVRALVSTGSDLIVGGGFVQAGGLQVNSVARWDGSNWSALGGGATTGVDNEVLALAVVGTDLYVGGAFQNAGGQSANRIARWNGSAWSALSGTSDPDQNGVDADVNALLPSGNGVYVAGLFTAAVGVRANRFALFDGQQWSSLGSGSGAGVNGYIYALAVQGNQLYAGGRFNQAGGRPANAIARWNGSSWSTLGDGADNGVDGEVDAMVVMGGSLYVAGAFSNAGGVAASNIARWDGTQWSALGEGTNNTIGALTVSNGELYAAGLFDQAGGQPASLIARWDGARWHALGSGLGNPQANEFVVGLAAAGGQLYAGGSFLRAGSVSANYVARWDGAQWQALGTGTDYFVFTLAEFAGSVYAGGAFTMAGGNPAAGIARWDGNRWNALGPPDGQGVSNQVLALTVADGGLYVGGSFSSAGVSPANSLARWDGARWLGLGLQAADQVVTALASDGAALFVNGNGLTQTPLPTLLSGAAGLAANGESLRPAVSRSAEVIAFSSKAANLVANELNPRADVFVRRRASTQLQRVSDLVLALAAGVVQDYERASVSGDGSVVAFQGSSGQVYSVIGGAAHVLTVAGNGPSANPVATADGSRVAFESTATNLAALPAGAAASNVFLAAAAGGAVELISAGPGGVAANGPSFEPAPDATGQTVAFVSLATNLGPVPGAAKAGTVKQVLLRRASIGGAAAVTYVSSNLGSGALGNADSDGVRLTPDGRFGVFQSDASNLVADDDNGVKDIFFFEMAGQRVARLLRVSRSSLGVQANGASRNPSISDDGQRVSFETDADNLVGLDLNNQTDVLVYSVSTGEILRLAGTTDGAQPNGASGHPVVSGDGSTVLFDSTAGNLAAGDNNGFADIFAVQLGAPDTAPDFNFSGAWYDPAQSGHGLFMEQLPGGRLLAWWFTFDPQGRQAWFGGVGSIIGKHAVISVTRTDGPGGRFIPNFNASQVVNQPFGTLTIDFADCGRAAVQFDLLQDFGRGSMALERLTQPADVGGCLRGVDATSASASGPIGNVTGAWFDPAQSGHGLFVESLADGRLLAWWFTFNPAGGQAWFGAVGTISGQSADMVALKTVGGRWIPNFDPRQIDNQPLGSMRLDFSSCSTGVVQFDLQQGFGRGSMLLQRLTSPQGQACGP